MGKKKISPEEQMREYCSSIRESRDRWQFLNENGGSDPFWPDGCNMNLVRNHIIYYKHRIMELCDGEHLLVPDEYYIPLPPPVDDNYMAKPQKERIRKFREEGRKITTRKAAYDDTQLSFW